MTCRLYSSSVLLVLSMAICAGCSTGPSSEHVHIDTFAPVGRSLETWTIAIHGGAGTISRDSDEAVISQYVSGMEQALTIGIEMLQRGDAALDVVEVVVRQLEDNAAFNAGRGSVFTEKGNHELDASIMDGSTLSAGAVASVRTVRHPVTLARAVMEHTDHVLLAGDGAEGFADVVGVERVENTWFDTDRRRQSLQRVLEQRKLSGQNGQASSDAPPGGSTVGCVVQDQAGYLAAATSTGGMTAKKWGRIGDSPIIGAGTYANDLVAVSGTGVGEEFIRHSIAHQIAALMEYRSESLSEAVGHVLSGTLEPDIGGVIAIDAQGGVVLGFNTRGMYRAAANSAGHRLVAIWTESIDRTSGK